MKKKNGQWTINNADVQSFAWYNKNSEGRRMCEELDKNVLPLVRCVI